MRAGTGSGGTVLTIKVICEEFLVREGFWALGTAKGFSARVSLFDVGLQFIDSFVLTVTMFTLKGSLVLVRDHVFLTFAFEAEPDVAFFTGVLFTIVKFVYAYGT